jgi:two-component system KDP operon response regulator KdpE
MIADRDAPVAASTAAHAAAGPAGPLVLVVEDELPMQKMLGVLLETNGLRTVQATSGAEAVGRAAEYNPDLVLLDLGLPDSDGTEIARQLREWMVAPIVVISARGREQDKVAVLDAGANDYLTKPFANGELLARIRVWLRDVARAAGVGAESVVEVGELRIDLGRRVVSVAGREVHLTPTEYKLFAALMRNAGRIMTHQQLLEAAWGPRYARETQYLRVYMGQLRRKLEPEAIPPRYLLTVSGVGYQLRTE